MNKIIENWEVGKYRYKKGIYHLTITEKHHYVGSSVNLCKRLLRHRSDLLRKNHDNIIMQRCFDKYGYDTLKWEILEICDDNISYKDLLVREEYYIDLLKPDMNIKLDPVTQQACPTTSKKVFQFNQFGELLEEWDCISEAARHLNVDSSGITVSCNNRTRQRICAGFLWDYEPVYTGELKVIYVFDLDGNYINRFINTTEVYENLFSDKKRKTVLSQLNKRIDSGIPYLNIYLSYDKYFKINPDYKPKYKEKDELDVLLSQNPMVYKFGKDGTLLDKKLFNEWPNYSNFIRKEVRTSYYNPKSSKTYYSIDPTFKPPRYSNYNDVKVKVTNQQTGEIKEYASIKDATTDLFTGTPKEMDLYYKNVRKHMDRNTIYKGYLFERVL